jgi:hypothetical protein
MIVGSDAAALCRPSARGSAPTVLATGDWAYRRRGRKSIPEGWRRCMAVLSYPPSTKHHRLQGGRWAEGEGQGIGVSCSSAPLPLCPSAPLLLCSSAPSSSCRDCSCANNAIRTRYHARKGIRPPARPARPRRARYLPSKRARLLQCGGGEASLLRIGA